MTGPGRPSEALVIHLQRVLPVAQSVLWHPTSPGVVQRRPPSGAYPVFFDQKAISAIHTHYEAAGRQGMMGFLVGDLFECPTSHVRYVVIDSTIRLNQAVYGDKTLVIVSRLWDRIQDELRKTEGHLIGWYHSHPPIAVELAPGDVETHLQYFKRPWHVALVLGAEHEGPVAGLFRPRPGETSPTVSMPFYELIESDEGFAGGKKRSLLPWINFLSDDPAVVYADSSGQPMPQPPSHATLQVVRPGGTGTTGQRPAAKSGPVPAVPAGSPSGKVRATQSPTPPPRPAPPLPPTPPLPPPPLPPAKPAPPNAGTTARPALGERPAPAPPAWPGAPRRRESQLRPPPNALSNLPLLAAGGYDLGEAVPRESDPDVVTPREQPRPSAVAPPQVPQRPGIPIGRPPASPVRRPTQTPKPFAPALSRRKSDGHPALVAGLILLLLGGGGFAGWYYFLRPASAAAPGGGGGGAPAAVSTTVTPAPAAAPPTASPPAAAPPAIDSSLSALDRLADSVSTMVRRYGVRIGLFSANKVCGGLSDGLVSVEDVWTSYSVGKRRAPPLDPARVTRDQSLYAAVDSVERQFDRSGCQRP
jgi:proteasome lid subunit RPN8/RPN11